MARPVAPPPPPPRLRVDLARKRAPWAWERLHGRDDVPRSIADGYLASRGLNPERVREREEIRETYLRVAAEDCARAPELERLRRLFAVPGMAIPVRSPKDGALVDVRVRRYEPRTFADGTKEAKIVGMLGGVTALAQEAGRGRELVGCYGRPHAIDHDLVVVVEGLIDYLTACVVWPGACVLGAVDAGSISLVAGHAANALGARDDVSRLLIVEQNDGGPKKAGADGHETARAADRSVNEDVNAAAKVAIRAIGPRRVGWLFCDLADDNEFGASTYKDLNDLVRAGVDLAPLVRWWSDDA